MSSPAGPGCTTSASVLQYYGPLFLGGVSATFLSGMMVVQTVVYVKLYHEDPKYLKALVFVVWAIDITQTGLTWKFLWFYLVRNFGDLTKLDDIPISLTMVAILGWITIMLVQCCYLHRIFCLSNRNFWIVVPVAILIVIRFAWILGASTEMLHLKKFTPFMTEYKWLVTIGLCFSATVDVTITITLAFLLLTRSRSCLGVGNQVMQVMVLTNLPGILDSLILYTLELGSITGLVTILSLVCWLRLDNHMIFVGLYASFGKLHGGCLMAMLNMRYILRQKPPQTHEGNSRRPQPPHLQNGSLSESSPVQLEPVHVE